MRLFYLVVLTLVSTVCYSANGVTKTSTPNWVKPIEFSDEDILEGNGSYQYLLIDIQDNIIKQSRYRHYALKVLNSEGVQSMSDIDISFDPSYQKLQFHQVRIIRDGSVIDRFDKSKINTIQRETQMERSLYDGTLSAIINLADVKENDIIEYAYTRIGFNPINKGNFATTYYHQHTVPVNRIFNRLITNSENDVQYKLYDGASKPKKIVSGNQIEYLLDLSALEFELYDSNIPGWFDPHRRISFSTFDSWRQVVEWALPLYNYRQQEVERIKELLDTETAGSKEDKILELIRLVQDDVRYLGFESGIGAYKPNPPTQVFDQRYGDCKDKSLLLVSLLRSEGVTAFPLLIATQLKQDLQAQLPSNRAFDHCVVNFQYDGNDYYIDPTISNQGGSLANIAFPNYKSGLLVKEGEENLIEIQDAVKPTTDINELISLDSIGGDASFTVRTEYTGSKADYMRSYFSTNSRDHIQKEYLNYYSYLYPDIQSADEIRFYDYERNSTNKVIVEEYYTVKNFWQDSDDQSYIYSEVYPLVLESQIGYPKSAGRDMPYYLGAPYLFTQTSKVDLPEDWTVEESDTKIEGDGFVYSNRVIGEGRSITVHHSYELTKEYISGDSVSKLMEKHEDIRSELSFQLTYDQSLFSSNVSWLSVLLGLIGMVVGIVFAIKIYQGFDPDPDPWGHAENKPIGGWLILPAIGITISPLILLIQTINEDNFSEATWIGLNSDLVDQSTALMVVFGVELIYNFIFIVFSVLILILFYQRRTSVPRLISIFYVLSFLFPLIDHLLVEYLLPGYSTAAENAEIQRDILRSFIGAAIWVPYFNISKRVKSTFCKKYQNAPLEEVLT